MKDEYDFSNAIKNPYTKRIKKQVTINLDESTVEYFKALSQKCNIPYQTLINMYLADCAAKKLELKTIWS